MIRRVRTTAAVIGVAILAAGCGSGSSDEHTTSTKAPAKEMPKVGVSATTATTDGSK